MDNKAQNVNLKLNKVKLAIGILIAVSVVVFLTLFISSKTLKSNQVVVNNVPKQVSNTQTTDNQPVANPEAIKDSHVEVAGANPISKDNVVLTPIGSVAKNDAPILSPEAPHQTTAIAKTQLSSGTLKIDVSTDGFSPTEITAKAGAPVTVSVTSVDKYYHVFTFSDPALAAVAIGVGAGETRAITFNAPTKAGEYAFNCDITCHGSNGKLIVK